MKRMKVFIIALISILLIVTFGRISMADEPTIKKQIENGKVFITLNGLKHDYENVLCVSKGVSVKHTKHGANEQVEYILQGTAEIDGNDITLTKYNWLDNYTRLSEEVSTEKIVTENGEGNILAATLGNITYQNNPRFIRFMNDNNLPFESYESFGKQEIIKRRELYKKIVDIIWNIDNLKI